MRDMQSSTDESPLEFPAWHGDTLRETGNVPSATLRGRRDGDCNVAKYELSRAADRDLGHLRLQFGPLQTDVYFESLEECLRKLAENPLLGIFVSNNRRFVHQRHLLYYKKIKTGVRMPTITCTVCCRQIALVQFGQMASGA